MDGRRHRAGREIVIVPIVIGSPEPMRHVRPPRYPNHQHAPWRPAHAIPARGGANLGLLRRIVENSFPTQTFTPGTKLFSDTARARFHQLEAKKS